MTFLKFKSNTKVAIRKSTTIFLLVAYKFTTGATSGAGTAYPSEHLSSPPDFRVTRSLALCICFVDRCLFFCTLSFGHCTVCSSSICGFWLPLFGIFKLYNLKFSMYGFVNHCLSFSSFSFVVSFVLLITDTECYFDIIKLSSIPVRQWSSSYE